jgi:hypothetical protein
MSTSRPRRINRRTAEQLLRGARADEWGAGPDALAGLLAAASAPAREDELAGQPAAMAAFRSAQFGPVPQLRRRSVIKSALVTSLAAKIAAVAVIVVSGAGIATAAMTGHLPVHPAPAATIAPASRSTESRTGPSPTGRGTAGENTSAAAPGLADSGRTAPAPDLVGLCHAYAAGAGGHGAHLSPAFTVLVNAAGGEAKVPAYCATLSRGDNGAPPSTGGQAAGAPAAQRGGAQHPTPTPPTKGSPNGGSAKPTADPSHPTGVTGAPGH